MLTTAPFGTVLMLGGALLAGNAHAGTRIVWPAPPDEPRIAFVESIQGSIGSGAPASLLGRVGHWLTGSGQGSHSLVKPFGIALDEDGNICLTDTGAGAVCFFDGAKKKWLRWEKVGGMQFVSPVAVAKRNGTLFVADSGLGRIVVFGQDGALRFVITNHLAQPSGIAIANGGLAVVDSARHAVVLFGMDGSYVSEFGGRGGGPGQFNFPTHIASDETGRLLVTDSMNSRVQIFDGSGKFLRQFGTRGDVPGCFSRPKGVAVDSFGHIYVVDALFGNVQLFDGEGRLLMSLGRTGTEPGEFWLPNGVAISRDNKIYIADSYNRRVQVLQFIGSP
jgi:DNA-binding beta-propeller fold protein YncE